MPLASWPASSPSRSPSKSTLQSAPSPQASSLPAASSPRRIRSARSIPSRPPRSSPMRPGPTPQPMSSAARPSRGHPRSPPSIPAAPRPPRPSAQAPHRSPCACDRAPAGAVPAHQASAAKQRQSRAPKAAALPLLHVRAHEQPQHTRVLLEQLVVEVLQQLDPQRQARFGRLVRGQHCRTRRSSAPRDNLAVPLHILKRIALQRHHDVHQHHQPLIELRDTSR